MSRPYACFEDDVVSFCLHLCLPRKAMALNGNEKLLLLRMTDRYVKQCFRIKFITIRVTSVRTACDLYDSV